MIKNIYSFFVVLFLISIIYACRQSKPFDSDEYNEVFTADYHTAIDDGAGAYAHPLIGLSAREEAFHDLGDVFFETNFVPNQANYHASGLGPLYNNISCVSCHPSDGRGKAPLPGEVINSMLFKLALPGLDSKGFPNKVTGFGGQLQDKAIIGSAIEGKVDVQYIESNFQFPDGETVKLRKPIYTLTNLYQPISSQVIVSPRLARPVYGVGFLESISEESILKNVDEMDVDGDGISGKANYVYDFVNNKEKVLGRIGWKASVANIKSQVTRALNEDIGITSSVVPDEQIKGQIQEPNSSGIELPDSIVDALTFYIRTLSVPARRDVKNEQIIQGKKLFSIAGCASCHTPNHQTEINPAFKPLSGLNIFPYTDLLLHDMGLDLADGFSEFEAKGNEWRTPPLWGIGLTQKVNGHTNFLHDGRARNFTEAILWHGGEAIKAKTKFVNYTKNERLALIKFLESL